MARALGRGRGRGGYGLGRLGALARGARRGGLGAGRGRAGGFGAPGAGGEVGELAGLREFNEVLQAAEDADEECQNQGVQNRQQPGLGCIKSGFGAEVCAQGGDVHGQGGGGMI